MGREREKWRRGREGEGGGEGEGKERERERERGGKRRGIVLCGACWVLEADEKMKGLIKKKCELPRGERKTQKEQTNTHTHTHTQRNEMGSEREIGMECDCRS